MHTSILLLLSLLHLTFSVQDITHFGAIKNDDSLQAHLANQKALTQAIETAKSPSSQGDARIVVIPSHKYYSLPIVI